MKRKLGDGQTFLFSEHSGEYAITHKPQDLTKLLDQNKRLQQEECNYQHLHQEHWDMP